ncbi:hypothetical protein TNCV_5038541 [Trichonephila clavipes]|nr:hypothetical protein TNCV_5038541 [Trichonephila clavipes]
MVQEDTGDPSEGATFAWMEAMKQLAVRLHFLRCGGLLDNWAVERVLSLVFVKRHLSDPLVPTPPHNTISERPN